METPTGYFLPGRVDLGSRLLGIFLVVVFVVVFAVIAVNTASSVFDLSCAVMAIPTLISSVWLAPKVIEKAREYFATLESETSSI